MDSLFDNVEIVKEKEVMVEDQKVDVFDGSMFIVLEGESPTGFLGRVLDRFKDLVTGDVFDYKVGYIANLDRDTRKAKNTILSKLTYEYIKEHYDDVYHAPYGLQMGMETLKPYLNKIEPATHEIESEVDRFKRVIGKYISSATYRQMPIAMKTNDLVKTKALNEALNNIIKGNDYNATGVTLGVLVGNATEFHRTAVLISSMIHTFNEKDIATFQDKIKGLESLLDAVYNITIEDDDQGDLLDSIVKRVSEMADAITTIGKAFYVLTEMSKLLTIIANDIDHQ